MTMSAYAAEQLIRDWGHAQGWILWEDMLVALQSQRDTVDDRLRQALEVIAHT
jgi:hypothetical protein